MNFATLTEKVSVAGFLGYDVLDEIDLWFKCFVCVSVAGFLGYDVLAISRRC